MLQSTSRVVVFITMASGDDLQLHEYLEQDYPTQNGKLNPFNDGYDQLPSPRSSVTGKQSRHSAFEDEEFTSALSDLYVRDRTRSSLPASASESAPAAGRSRLVIAIDHGTTYTGTCRHCTSFLGRYKIWLTTIHRARVQHNQFH